MGIGALLFFNPLVVISHLYNISSIVKINRKQIRSLHKKSISCMYVCRFVKWDIWVKVNNTKNNIIYNKKLLNAFYYKISFMNSQHTSYLSYTVFKNPVLNAILKIFWYTKITQTQIWYGEINYSLEYILFCWNLLLIVMTIFQKVIQKNVENIEKITQKFVFHKYDLV